MMNTTELTTNFDSWFCPVTVWVSENAGFPTHGSLGGDYPFLSSKKPIDCCLQGIMLPCIWGTGIIMHWGIPIRHYVELPRGFVTAHFWLWMGQFPPNFEVLRGLSTALQLMLRLSMLKFTSRFVVPWSNMSCRCWISPFWVAQPLGLSANPPEFSFNPHCGI